MDINRMTHKVQEALAAAQSLAARNNNQQIDVEHLLAALLEQEDGLARAILNKAEVDAERLARRTREEIGRFPRVSGPSGAPDQIYITG
ncbi:MAG: Clp protease N-terminal domain-containing protein, partial [Bacteroidota bacterium]